MEKSENPVRTPVIVFSRRVVKENGEENRGKIRKKNEPTGTFNCKINFRKSGEIMENPRV